MAKKLFITGTGTDVGKTFVAGLIVKKLAESGKSCAYYKGAMSGNEKDLSGDLIPGDALHVKKVSGIVQPLSEMCPYVYETAVSPHLASRIEGNPVKLEKILSGYEAVRDKYEYITAEGSGGILCPLNFNIRSENECPAEAFQCGESDPPPNLLLEDMITALNMPCILVADAGLGTINSVVLTVSYMKAKNIKIKGVIFNNCHTDSVMEADNIRMCEYMTGLKTIACIEEGASRINTDANTLAALYEDD